MLHQRKSFPEFVRLERYRILQKFCIVRCKILEYSSPGLYTKLTSHLNMQFFLKETNQPHLSHHGRQSWRSSEPNIHKGSLQSPCVQCCLFSCLLLYACLFIAFLFRAPPARPNIEVITNQNTKTLIQKQRSIQKQISSIQQ